MCLNSVGAPGGYVAQRHRRDYQPAADPAWVRDPSTGDVRTSLVSAAGQLPPGLLVIDVKIVNAGRTIPPQGALFEWMKAQCAWEAELDRAERRATGEPFTVPRWMIGGHTIPVPRDVPVFQD